MKTDKNMQDKSEEVSDAGKRPAYPILEEMGPEVGAEILEEMQKHAEHYEHTWKIRGTKPESPVDLEDLYPHRSDKEVQSIIKGAAEKFLEGNVDYPSGNIWEYDKGFIEGVLWMLNGMEDPSRSMADDPHIKMMQLTQQRSVFPIEEMEAHQEDLRQKALEALGIPAHMQGKKEE